MMKTLILLTLLIFTQSKFVPPVVKIGGNTGPVEYGEMVILSADFDQTKLPEGLVDINFNWTVLDDGKKKRVFITNGGKEIAFAVGLRPRKIIVILDVNCLFERKESVTLITSAGDKSPTPTDIISEAEAISPDPILTEVVVGTGPAPLPPGPNPNPNPNPNPAPPSPSPVFPDGQFGLAKFMYDTFTADTNLNAATKAQLASKLADSLDGIAAKIVAVANYRDLATILADTKKSNDTAFASIPGLDLTRAEHIKLTIGQKISQLYKDQKINNANDLAIAWREMSQGLRQVK